ncbi:MAG: hypothetical protein K0S70_4732 [Microbacterium sp.]|jgi:hypothetical protein|nr:hypothetical protein [Microbacterium sp.]
MKRSVQLRRAINRTGWPEPIAQEVLDRRRRDSFGGYLWPSADELRMEFRGEKPMTGEEVVEELEWLLRCGVHPDQIAKQLGKEREALGKTAERYDRPDLAINIRPRALEGAKERRFAA